MSFQHQIKRVNFLQSEQRHFPPDSHVEGRNTQARSEMKISRVWPGCLGSSGLGELKGLVENSGQDVQFVANGLLMIFIGELASISVRQGCKVVHLI